MSDLQPCPNCGALTSTVHAARPPRDAKPTDLVPIYCPACCPDVLCINRRTAG